MHALTRKASDNLHIDMQKALEFYVVFSRFEYALKEQLYVHKGKKPKNLEVNFDTFAKDIRTNFAKAILDEATLKVAVSYFCQNPPRKQIWDGTKPDWSPAETGVQPTSYEMLLLIRQVRNNLFHGGKGWLSPEGNAERDKILMTHAITMIAAMIECHADVKQAFSSFQ